MGNQPGGGIGGLILAGAFIAYRSGISLFSPDLPGESALIASGDTLSAAMRGWPGGPVGQPVIAHLVAQARYKVK